MKEEIPIITGDPLKREGGASFTCFVLPFRYRKYSFSSIEAKEIADDDKPYFQPMSLDSLDWINRQRYFTGETARVLYNHACWFEVPKLNWDKSNCPKLFNLLNEQYQKITVQLHPPRMVLFEYQNAQVNTENILDFFYTGFLIIKASFVDDGLQPTTYRSLLTFNELFRYWRVPFSKHIDSIKRYLGNVFGDTPDKLYFDRWADLLDFPFKDPVDHKLYRLFPANWRHEAKSWWCSEVYNNESSNVDKKPGWICYADNRAFVWSCAVVEGGSNALEKIGNDENEEIEKLGGWIKFLNIDPPSENIADLNNASEFEKEWAQGRSYGRWLHYGTLYGFNYHAGVMLAGQSANPPIVSHFHNQYLDMTLLLLYLRITLFRFSNELTRLSSEIRCTRKFKTKHREEFKALRREFAVFTNLYQFPLISNQQQAIEMYALIREHMDVQELFKEVEEEIKSSHEYFEFEESSMLNRWVVVLTLVAIVVAILTLVADWVEMQKNLMELGSWIKDFF